MCVCGGGGRAWETETETDRQTNGQTDRQKHRQRERGTETETERQRQRLTQEMCVVCRCLNMHGLPGRNRSGLLLNLGQKQTQKGDGYKRRWSLSLMHGGIWLSQPLLHFSTAATSGLSRSQVHADFGQAYCPFKESACKDFREIIIQGSFCGVFIRA